MNKDIMKSLNTLIDEFEVAVRADEFSGGGAPEDIPLIEEDLKQARKALWEGITAKINGERRKR